MNYEPLIEAYNIKKTYGRITAVDNLSLTISNGICLGLLGPNGAGKTTLIEIIEDIIPETSGQILFKGRPRSASFREKIGIMFQQTALLSFMTVKETLTTFKNLYHDTYDIPSLMELCHLHDIRNQYNDKISGGQRQRLLLALALVNKPELLFLDEPSTGLDPQARRNLWDIIDTIKGQGKSIVLTTHYMEEAQELCNEVAIMDHGRIMAQGNPKDLINQYSREVNLIFPKENFNISSVPSSFDVSELNDRIVLKVEDMNQAVETLIKAGVDLAHMQVQAPNLETVFLMLTGRRLRD
jgi:ABC-2 type transport system ATP-binding protein